MLFELYPHFSPVSLKFSVTEPRVARHSTAHLIRCADTTKHTQCVCVCTFSTKPIPNIFRVFRFNVFFSHDFASVDTSIVIIIVCSVSLSSARLLLWKKKNPKPMSILGFAIFQIGNSNRSALFIASGCISTQHSPHSRCLTSQFCFPFRLICASSNHDNDDNNDDDDDGGSIT